MAQGLPVSRVVRVNVTIAPRAAAFRNFGTLMVLGSTDVIDVGEGRREYETYEGVLADFSSTDPEALFANLFFSQDPQPDRLFIGRWAQTATKGTLRGGVLSGPDRLMTNFTAVTGGSLTLTVDGNVRNLTGMNLSGATNLNAVASIVQAALVAAGSTGATVVWDANNNRFTVKSGTTGTSSVVGYSTTPGAGTDIGSLMKLKINQASVPVAGVAAETLISAITRLGDSFTDWYGISVATSTPPDTASHIAAAAYVEATDTSRIYGVTITDSSVLDPTNSLDLASQLKSLGYNHTVVQYSANPYAIASFLGRAFTVDFDGTDTTITMKFKVEPGVVPEFLTTTQANALRDKNCNVYVYYNNDTAIIEEAVMSGGYFFDEVHGIDWLQNNAQTRIFNLLRTQPKVPQTDDGINQLVNQVNLACEDGVRNGLIAPGIWNGPKFGPVKTGQMLGKGYLSYAQPVASQAQINREQRKAPPIQTAVKFAGAVHFSDVFINVNR